MVKPLGKPHFTKIIKPVLSSRDADESRSKTSQMNHNYNLKKTYGRQLLERKHSWKEVKIRHSATCGNEELGRVGPPITKKELSNIAKVI